MNGSRTCSPKSHYKNTTVLYIVQNLFPKIKESRTTSLNSQNMVAFRDPRDASNTSHLGLKFVQEAFNDATSVPYGYLLVDLKHETQEDLPSFQTTVFSTCTCRRYKTTECAVRLSISTMYVSPLARCTSLH